MAQLDLFAQSESGNGPVSMVTQLGVVAGDVLDHLERHGAMSLRTLTRQVEWPSPQVVMAVGALIRQGLIRGVQYKLEIVLEPVVATAAA